MEHYPVKNTTNTTTLKISPINMKLDEISSSQLSQGKLPVLENKDNKLKKKSKKRCNHPDCNKKLSLVDKTVGLCRCKMIFCELHREPNKHCCTFDWHTCKRNELASELNNNKCVAVKLQAI
jgi:hypothetical protein